MECVNALQQGRFETRPRRYVLPESERHPAVARRPDALMPSFDLYRVLTPANTRLRALLVPPNRPQLRAIHLTSEEPHPLRDDDAGTCARRGWI